MIVGAVNMDVYIPVSLAMFLEYAIWGAWAPVLAARLLGPLKMSGKQTGWIYATLPLGCMVAPLVAGQLADQWLNMEWILAGAHFAGAVFLLLAARTEKFGKLFSIMLIYSFFYAATLPLVNAVLFSRVEDIPVLDRGKVFIWAPVAWALAGYFLSGWRWVFKTEGRGRDCLYLAAILSVAMGVGCLYLPASPPAETGEIPIFKAFGMLGNPDFLLFIIVSMVIAGLMQFYFLGTAQFMQDTGIPGKNVPASMAVAQAVQAAATWFLLGFFLSDVGFKWTLVIGAGSWACMYLIYTMTRPPWLIVSSQGLHGLAYVSFMIMGQIFAEEVAKPEIRSSMQALIFFATVGVGLFLGTQFAGIVMDRFSLEGKFQWRKIWIVPLVIMLLGAVVLAVFFNDKIPG